MNRRLTKVVALVLAGVLLVGSVGLAGCGEEEEVPEILVGVLTDFTGPASSAVIPTIEALRDYFRMLEEEDPIPGVKVSFINYDQRTDYARTVPGWIWLAGQGITAGVVLSPHDNNALADRYEADKIPVLCSMAVPELFEHDWLYASIYSEEAQAEAILQWILDDWDGTGLPKVGHMGTNISLSHYLQRGIDPFLAEHEGEIEWIGQEKGMLGGSAWASEIMNLEDCDYIIISLVGPMTASFVNEARQRGYEGKLVSDQNNFVAYWELIAGVTPPQELYDCYYTAWWPWWNEDVPMIRELTAWVEEHRAAEAESWYVSSGPVTGWQMGMILSDAIRRAVEEVGAEDVDGTAIRDALAETHLEVEGVGDVWEITGTKNILAKTQRIFEWIVDDQEWVAVWPGGGEEWYLAPSMEG